MIELMIVVAIVAILVVIGLPSVSDWLQNSRMRTVADSLQNGIRFAQGEAARVSRLTTLTTTSSSWRVDVVQLTGSSAPIDTRINPLQTSPAGNLDLVTITPDATGHTVLQFNDLGRVSAAATSAGPFSALTADASFTVASTKGSRKLKVRVSPSGKVRMCDPDKPFSDTYPDGCDPAP